MTAAAGIDHETAVRAFGCPDQGRCWHVCPVAGDQAIPCWRVANAEPLGVWNALEGRAADADWPEQIRALHRLARAAHG